MAVIFYQSSHAYRCKPPDPHRGRRTRAGDVEQDAVELGSQDEHEPKHLAALHRNRREDELQVHRVHDGRQVDSFHPVHIRLLHVLPPRLAVRPFPGDGEALPLPVEVANEREHGGLLRATAVDGQ